MYSVIRFSDINTIQAKDIVSYIQEVSNTFNCDLEQHRKDESCFSCSLSNQDDWNEHLSEICSIISEICPALNKARANIPGLSVQVDVQIDACENSDSDLLKITKVYWPPVLLKIFSNNEIFLEISVYHF